MDIKEPTGVITELPFVEEQPKPIRKGRKPKTFSVEELNAKSIQGIIAFQKSKGMAVPISTRLNHALYVAEGFLDMLQAQIEYARSLALEYNKVKEDCCCEAYEKEYYGIIKYKQFAVGKPKQAYITVKAKDGAMCDMIIDKCPACGTPK